jgi:hypothetical protein
VTSLPDVAKEVGANRILRAMAGRFHHPLGDPSRPFESERHWRKNAVLAALGVLQKPVDGPTIFEV